MTDLKTNSKAQLRTKHRASFAALSSNPHARALCQAKLEVHLSQLLLRARGRWAAYRALPDEPDVFSCLPSEETRWSFPAVIDTESIEFRAGSEFSPGFLGILEPGVATTLRPADIDGFLVPGLAFDRQGGRLGRGKGYYDRYFSQSTNGIKIGIAYSTQIAGDPLPMEARDARMDAVVTDEGIIWASARRL